MDIPLDKVILWNTVADWVYFVSLVIFAVIARHLISDVLSVIVFRLIRKRVSDITQADFKRLFIQPLEALVLLLFMYLAFTSLHLPPEFSQRGSSWYRTGRLLNGLFNGAMIAAITWVVLRIVDFISLVFKKRAEKTVSKMDDQLVPFFTDFTKVFIYLFGLVAILGIVFKVNVAGLIAGLGVGGLALAFAAKESLENLIASFMIFMDQPFVVGDLVQVNDIVGHVERIGFRSTRIRTIDRSFVTVPNKLMIDKPLDNLTLRTFRRAKFNVSLTYDTPSEKIREVVSTIQQAIDQHPRTNDEGRASFYALGDHAKVIMVFYYIDTMDYYEYLTVREELNFRIVEIVEQHGCEFAYPTQKLFVQHEEPFGLPDSAVR